MDINTYILIYSIIGLFITIVSMMLLSGLILIHTTNRLKIVISLLIVLIISVVIGALWIFAFGITLIILFIDRIRYHDYYNDDK